MAQTRGTFPALYDGVAKTVTMLLGKAVQELPKIYTKYFNVKNSTKRYERVQTGVGFTNIPEKGEGAPYSADQFQQGYLKSFEHVEFGRLWEVTETAQEDDEYDILAQKAKFLGFAARYTIETYAANILNNGFTSEKSADGEYIFDSDHPLKRGGTAKNLHASADDLSATSLVQAMVDMQTETKLDSGQITMPIQSFQLIVPPALEATGYRLVKSEGLPGVADNDKNPIKGLRSWEIIVNPLLTDSDAWFVANANKSMHGLTSYVRVPISIKAAKDEDARTGNLITRVRFRQSFGCIQWQGLYGSPGS